MSIIVLACFLVAACTPDARTPLSAERVVVTRDIPGMPMRAAYMTISNNTDAPVSITSVSSPQFEEVSIHETTMENDVARMRPLGVLVIPPGEAVTLEPGGKHLMLARPRTAESSGTIRQPDGDAITLNLYNGEQRILSVTASTGSPKQ